MTLQHILRQPVKLFRVHLKTQSQKLNPKIPRARNDCLQQSAQAQNKKKELKSCLGRHKSKKKRSRPKRKKKEFLIYCEGWESDTKKYRLSGELELVLRSWGELI